MHTQKEREKERGGGLNKQFQKRKSEIQASLSHVARSCLKGVGGREGRDERRGRTERGKSFSEVLEGEERKEGGINA